MASLRARLVNFALPLLGVKRFFSEPDRLEERIAALRKKAPVRPGRALQKEFAIEEDGRRGFPVVTIAPRNGLADGAPHLLYFHGGGYVMPISAFHWNAIAHLCRDLGASATVPLYPLAPETKAIETLDLMRGLTEDVIAASGSRQVVMLGDSAGGGMALALTQMLLQDGAPMPASLVLFSPWLDATASDPRQKDIEGRDRMLAVAGLGACADLFRGDLARDDPRISPLLGPLDGLPPVAIFSGTSDILLVDGQRLDAKLTSPDAAEHVYIEYDGMFHDWMLLPVPEGKAALDQAADFIRRHSIGEP